MPSAAAPHSWPPHVYRAVERAAAANQDLVHACGVLRYPGKGTPRTVPPVKNTGPKPWEALGRNTLPNRLLSGRGRCLPGVACGRLCCRFIHDGRRRFHRSAFHGGGRGRRRRGGVAGFRAGRSGLRGLGCRRRRVRRRSDAGLLVPAQSIVSVSTSSGLALEIRPASSDIVRASTKTCRHHIRDLTGGSCSSGDRIPYPPRRRPGRRRLRIQRLCLSEQDDGYQAQTRRNVQDYTNPPKPVVNRIKHPRRLPLGPSVGALPVRAGLPGTALCHGLPD